MRRAHRDEACNLSATGRPHCAQDSVCISRSESGDGICRAKLGPGVECRYDWECDASAGLVCMRRRDETSGRCAPRFARGAEGDWTWQCAAGLHCAGACRDRHAQGESCAGSVESCLQELCCDRATRTCAARKPAGAACNGGDECLSWQCRGVCEPVPCAHETPKAKAASTRRLKPRFAGPRPGTSTD